MVEILEVSIAILQAFTYFTFFQKVWRKKGNRNIIMAGCIMMTASTEIAGVYDIPLIFKLGIGLLLGGISIKYAYQKTVKQLMIPNLTYIVLMLTSELLVASALMTFYKIDRLDIFLTVSMVRYQAMLLELLILFFLLMAAARKMNSVVNQLTLQENLILGVQVGTHVFLILIVTETMINYTGVGDEIPILLGMLSAVTVVAFIIAFKVTEGYFMSRCKEQQYTQLKAEMEKQEQYNKMKEMSQQQVRKLQHDIQTHLDVLEKMHGKTEEAEEYLGCMKKRIEPLQNYYDTGNTSVDMLLNEKKQTALQQGIQIEVENDVGSLRGYSTFGMCTIFSNAIDNALEACSVEKNTKKYVRIKIRNIKAGVSILFENSYAGEIAKKRGKYITNKKDKEMHGMGMGNIEDAVADCGGKMLVQAENNCFSLFILLDQTGFDNQIGI